LTRQQTRIKTQKLYKVQARKRLRKATRWVVNKSHNTIEQDNGITSTPTSTSPSKDQHSDGLHVIEVENIEKDGQPSIHMDLEKPRLK
jgi:hypothetical protein